MSSGIYIIKNTTNGKVYVGSAVCVLKRLMAHRYLLGKGAHHSRHLQNAWNKDGEHCFGFTMLEFVADTNNLISREQYWIDELGASHRASGYNISPTAGSQLGMKHTEEARRKIGAAFKGCKLTAEHRQKITMGLKCAFSSPEAKAKLSAARMGNKNGVGRVWTDKERARLSNSMLGNKYAQGHTHSTSPETRAKISKANSIALLGKKASPETRAKMSVSHLARAARKKAAEHDNT